MALPARKFMPTPKAPKKVDEKKIPSGALSRAPRASKPKPVSSSVNKRATAKAAAEAKIAALNLPKPGSRRTMGNKEMALKNKKSPYGPKGRPVPKKKTTKKFVVDPRYTAGF